MPDVRFKPIEISDRNLVEDYRRRFPIEVSEWTFTNLFVWREAMPVFLAEKDGCLFILRASHDGDAWLLPPLGECDLKDMVPWLLDLKHEGAAIAGMDRVPEKMAAQLKEAGLSVALDRDNSDYVYRREDLAELKGRDYHKKRNHVKKALARYMCRYEQIEGALVEKCRMFQDHWCDMRQCGRIPALCDEYAAIVQAFRYYDKLGLIGGAILIDDDVRAFSIGEALLPDTAVVHFEKADIAVDGLAQLMNHWFCQRSLHKFEYVNREQDLGIPGLRQAKESYYPHHMVNKYKVTLPDRAPAPAPKEEPTPCSKSME